MAHNGQGGLAVKSGSFWGPSTFRPRYIDWGTVPHRSRHPMQLSNPPQRGCSIHSALPLILGEARLCTREWRGRQGTQPTSRWVSRMPQRNLPLLYNDNHLYPLKRQAQRDQHVVTSGRPAKYWAGLCSTTGRTPGAL